MEDLRRTVVEDYENGSDSDSDSSVSTRLVSYSFPRSTNLHQSTRKSLGSTTKHSSSDSTTAAPAFRKNNIHSTVALEDSSRILVHSTATSLDSSDKCKPETTLVGSDKRKTVHNRDKCTTAAHSNGSGSSTTTAFDSCSDRRSIVAVVQIRRDSAASSTQTSSTSHSSTSSTQTSSSRRLKEATTTTDNSSRHLKEATTTDNSRRNLKEATTTGSNSRNSPAVARADSRNRHFTSARITDSNSRHPTAAERAASCGNNTREAATTDSSGRHSTAAVEQKITPRTSKKQMQLQLKDCATLFETIWEYLSQTTVGILIRNDPFTNSEVSITLCFLNIRENMVLDPGNHCNGRSSMNYRNVKEFEKDMNLVLSNAQTTYEGRREREACLLIETIRNYFEAGMLSIKCGSTVVGMSIPRLSKPEKAETKVRENIHRHRRRSHKSRAKSIRVTSQLKESIVAKSSNLRVKLHRIAIPIPHCSQIGDRRNSTESSSQPPFPIPTGTLDMFVPANIPASRSQSVATQVNWPIYIKEVPISDDESETGTVQIEGNNEPEVGTVEIQRQVEPEIEPVNIESDAEPDIEILEIERRVEPEIEVVNIESDEEPEIENSLEQHKIVTNPELIPVVCGSSTSTTESLSEFVLSLEPESDINDLLFGLESVSDEQDTSKSDDLEQDEHEADLPGNSHTEQSRQNLDEGSCHLGDDDEELEPQTEMDIESSEPSLNDPIPESVKDLMGKENAGSIAASNVTPGLKGASNKRIVEVVMAPESRRDGIIRRKCKMPRIEVQAPNTGSKSGTDSYTESQEEENSFIEDENSEFAFDSDTEIRGFRSASELDEQSDLDDSMISEDDDSSRDLPGPSRAKPSINNRIGFLPTYWVEFESQLTEGIMRSRQMTWKSIELLRRSFHADYFLENRPPRMWEAFVVNATNGRENSGYFIRSCGEDAYLLHAKSPHRLGWTCLNSWEKLDISKSPVALSLPPQTMILGEIVYIENKQALLVMDAAFIGGVDISGHSFDQRRSSCYSFLMKYISDKRQRHSTSIKIIMKLPLDNIDELMEPFTNNNNRTPNEIFLARNTAKIRCSNQETGVFFIKVDQPETDEPFEFLQSVRNSFYWAIREDDKQCLPPEILEMASSVSGFEMNPDENLSGFEKCNGNKKSNMNRTACG